MAQRARYNKIDGVVSELELGLIHTQMTQKPVLRAEGKCARVAQMARAKIRGREWPSPSQRARDLWVVRTLELHRRRTLTCGTRSSIIVEVKNGLSTHKAPCVLPPGKGPDRERAPFTSIQSCRSSARSYGTLTHRGTRSVGSVCRSWVDCDGRYGRSFLGVL
jgi:hypothetical protein